MCKVSMHCRGHRRRAIPQFARCVLGTVAPMHKSVTWHRGELASRERLAGIVEVTNGPVTLSAERVLLGQHGHLSDLLVIVGGVTFWPLRWQDVRARST